MNWDGTRSGWRARIRTWMRLRRRGNQSAGRPEFSPASGNGDPARSKRLGALLYLYMGNPADPLALRDELDPDELASLAGLTEEDRHLVNACLEVEAWVRPRQIRREIKLVERLLAADMFGEEEVDEVLESGDVVPHAKELLALMALGLLD